MPWSGTLYRIHRSELSPLYFSSNGRGRFDLSPPEGTLYGAGTEPGAFVEVFRSTLIPMAEVAQRHLAKLTATRPLRLAACGHKEARRFGVTAAIHSTPDYPLTQRWSAAFRRAGFDGIAYLLSHDPSASAGGLAIFGSDDGHLLTIDSDQPIDDSLIEVVQRSFGLIVVPVPGGLF